MNIIPYLIHTFVFNLIYKNMYFEYGTLQSNTSDEISNAVSKLLENKGLYHLSYCEDNDERINNENYITVKGDALVIMSLGERLVKNNMKLCMFISPSQTHNFSFCHFVIHPFENTESSQDSI